MDGDVILSQEGTTQGDPSMYVLTISSLIRRLNDLYEQVWYADDSAATGQLHAWWNRLAEHGQAFGYFPNPTKNWIVVKPSGGFQSVW